MNRITVTPGQAPLEFSHAIKSSLRTPSIPSIHQDVFVFAYAPPFTRKKADAIAPVWFEDLNSRGVFQKVYSPEERAAVIELLSDRLFSDWYSIRLTKVSFYADNATMVSVGHSSGAIAGYDPEQVRFYA